MVLLHCSHVELVDALTNQHLLKIKASCERYSQNEDERAWPSPRSWENLAIIAAGDLADDKNINISMATNLATACVGNAAAGEFGKYLQTLVIISPVDILNKYHKIKRMN